MTVWRMRIAYWMPKCTNTHSECEILMLLHRNNGYTSAPHYYVMRTLPVLLNLAVNGSDWTASRPCCFVVSGAHWVGGPVGCRSPLVTLNW